MLVIAQMDTEHFSFTAAAALESEAKAVLLAGFISHLESMGAFNSYDDALYTVEDYFEDRFEGPVDVKTLDDWYGIRTFSIEVGQVVRDQEQVVFDNKGGGSGL